LQCPTCLAEVDVARLETLVGKPRFVAERSWSGVEVGGILVEDVIGAGGMGTVYRARGHDGQALAVKFLSPSLAAETEFLARFWREVALLEKLDHPGIVKIRAHGEVQGVPWFAMDLVDGPTLAGRLAEGPLDLREAERIFAGLFDALGYAHEHGVVHRDLKPANVLLASDGARLADFGIARIDLQASTAKTQLTQTAAILGTLPYMSPEQRKGRTVDARSDLYSVGVMLYEALAGQRPEGAFPPLRRARGEVSGRLDRLVLRLLQPDPEARISSAVEARRDLSRALARPRTPRPLVLAAGGAAACALAASLLFGRGAPVANDRRIPPLQVSSSGVPKPEPEIPPPPDKSQPEPPAIAPQPKKTATGAATSEKVTRKRGGTGKAAPMPKSKSVDMDRLHKSETFLDLKNAQPAPVRQSALPLAQQAIPLLKQAKPQGEEEAPAGPEAGAKSPSRKSPSKGGKLKGDWGDDSFLGPAKK